MYVQNGKMSTWRQCNNRRLEAPWRPGDSRKLDNVCQRWYRETLLLICSKYTVRHGSSFRRLQQRKMNRSKSKCNSVNKVQCSTYVRHRFGIGCVVWMSLLADTRTYNIKMLDDFTNWFTNLLPDSLTTCLTRFSENKISWFTTSAKFISPLKQR